MISFNVKGRAVPQGSKRAFVNPKTNRAIMVEQHGKRHKDWRKLLMVMAQQKAPSPAFDGPVGVKLDFWFARPKKHFFVRKTGNVLRDDAPTWIDTKSVGDIDKLTRAVLDSLTDAGFMNDDSQVARIEVTRRWTDGTPNVRVGVWQIFEPDGMQ